VQCSGHFEQAPVNNHDMTVCAGISRFTGTAFRQMEKNGVGRV